MANDRQLLEKKSALESFLNTPGVSESELLPHLNIRAFIQLTRTNHGIHGLFAEEPRLRGALLDALMAHLSHIIVNDPSFKNFKALKKILNVYPELLTRKIKKAVFQQTGQTYINYSLLQLAYAEGDDKLCCGVLEPCFEHAFGSKDAAKEEIRKQLNEKFPEENEEEKKQRDAEELKIKNDLAALLTPVIQAITHEQFNSGWDVEKKLIPGDSSWHAVKKLIPGDSSWYAMKKLILSPVTLVDIATFREAFDALQPTIIVKGRRFRLNTLQEIYDAYSPAARQWPLDGSRYALFEDGVLSKALAYMPQNDAMRGAQGLYYLEMMHSDPFERRITIRNTNINFYDCLRGASRDFSSLIGSCVDIEIGIRSEGRRISDEAWQADIFKSYCQTKTENLQTLRSQQENILRLDQ